MNLSVRDLQDPYLADAFAEQLAALQISPRWLELEITESAVMTEPERALEVLSRLSSMGLRIAIDDFGTGYSSLSYLKKLPVNTIKIDKSFVIGMGRDENDAAIVRTSIDLAHNLKLEVVAEGVENEETLKRLSELGCDTAQGHYISRPLSADELALWLKQSSWGVTKRNPKLVRLHNNNLG
jgi:EAL domain-containing protein (putative c-di-GMP-specific phosphodiesterase class I)